MAVSWFPAAYQWGKISWSFFFFCVVSQRAPKDASATAITVWILLGNIWGSWNSTGLFSFSAAKWKQGGNQRTAGAARPRDEPNLCTKTSFSCTLAVILTVCLQQLCFWWEGGQQEVVAPPQTAQALTQQRTICSKITKARLKSREKTRLGSAEPCQDESDAVVFTRSWKQRVAMEELKKMWREEEVLTSFSNICSH